ncbi:MAG: hypothetical protein BZ138_01120, partial [Methanosphaera sp. rholeuAM270]
VVVKDIADESTITHGENLIAVTILEGTYNYTIDESGVTRITVPVSDNRQIVGITVEYLGNGTYKPSTGYNNATYTEQTHETLTSVTLKEHNSTLTLEVNPVIDRVGTVFNISGNFVDANGTAIVGAKLIISVNNSYYNDSVVTGEDGYYSVNFTSSAEGNYTVTVRFNSNGVVNSTVNTTTLRADKVFTNTSVRIVNNTQGNVTLAVNVTEADGTPITNGVLNITVGDKTEQYAFSEEENIISLKDIGLNIDSTTPVSVEIVYLGTNVYVNSTGKVAGSDDEFNQIVADKEFAVISVDVDPRNVTVEKIYDIFGNLTDINGNIISDANINITVKNSTDILYSVNVTTNDNTGKFNYSNNTLPAGTYTINVSFYDDNYEYTSAEVTLIVSKVITNTEVLAYNTTAGNVTVHVVVTDSKGREVSEGIVNIVNETGGVLGTATLNAENNGVVDIVLESIQTDGTYTFIANYEGTPKYDGSSDEITEDIVTRDVTIIVTPENSTFGNTSVKVNLTDATTGSPLPGASFNITDAGGVVVGNGTTLDDGTAVVNVTVPVGEQTLTVVYPGNDTYNATNKTFTINVEQRNSTSVAAVTNNTAGNMTVVVNVTDTTTGANVPNGPVEVYANGNLVGNATIADGRATVVTNITANGTYDIVVKYLGNENYTDSSYSVGDVLVVGRESNITAVMTNNTYGNTTVNVTVKDPVTDEPIGNATVVVTLPNGTEVNGTTDKDGNVEIPVDLPVGNNEIIVTYPGNETYNSTTIPIHVNVEPRESVTDASIINNTAGNTTVKVNVTDPVTNKPVPNGTVEVYVNGTLVGKGEIDNGTADIGLDINEIGNYDIEVKYSGTEEYKPSSDIMENVEVLGRDSSMTAEITNNTYQNTTVEVTLRDPATGEAIGNTTVEVTLPNGTKVNATTDKNGTVEIPVNLPVGDNQITITYPGNETFNPTNITIPVKVEPRNSTISVKVTNRTAGNVTIKVNVTDSTTNKAVPNGTVNVYVNNTKVGTGKVVDGTVTIPTNITDVGTQDINITYEGNNDYRPSSTVEEIKVTPRKTNLTAEVVNDTVGNTTIKVSLKDSATGKAIRNAPIQVLKDGKVIANATTDKNGKAVIPVDLPAGNNKISIVYRDNSSYKNTTRKIPVTVHKNDAKIKATIKNNKVDNTTIQVKVTDKNTGKAIRNATTVLTLENGTKVQAKTNNKGIATFNVKVPEGINNLNITVIETPYYNEARSNVKVNAQKEDVNLTVDEVRGIVGDKIVIRAHVTDLQGNPVTGGNVGFKINGKTVTYGLLFNTNDTTVYKQSVKNGIVNVELTAYKGLTGAVNITASYSGSSTYNANKSALAKMSIKMRTAQISVVTVALAKQDTDITFTAILADTTKNSSNSYVDGGYVQFKVNGNTLRNVDGSPIRVKVVNNAATITYHVPLGTSAVSSITGKPYNHTVTASYDNKAYYPGIRNTTVYNVETKTVNFTFNRVTVQNGILSVKADLKDTDGKYVVGKNTICVKINGKTYTEGNKTKYFSIQNGKVDITGIQTNGNKVKEVTLVSGQREPYSSVRTSTKDIISEKDNVIVKVDEVHGIVGDKLVIRAHVTDLRGNPVTGGNVGFKINGKTVTYGLLFNTNDTTVYKQSVKNGIVSVELTAYKGLTGAVNITASYSGSSTYQANRSSATKMSIKMRTAQISVVAVDVAKQDTDIKFTAILSDTTKNSSNSYVDGGYVQFKVNGNTLRNADGSPIRVKVVNNAATVTYHVPLGTGGVSYKTGLTKNYTVTASYDNKAYYSGIRNTTVYHVERKAIKFTFNKVTVQKGLLSVKADLKDTDGKYVVGKNTICLKINGKTYREGNKTRIFTVKNGKVELTGIQTNGNKVKEVTLVTGQREPYLSTIGVTTKIVTS